MVFKNLCGFELWTKVGRVKVGDSRGYPTRHDINIDMMGRKCYNAM